MTTEFDDSKKGRKSALIKHFLVPYMGLKFAKKLLVFILITPYGRECTLTIWGF